MLIGFCLCLFFCADRQDGPFRTNLGANRAARAKIRIDMNLFAFDIESRAGKLIDAISVVFAFIADIKGLTPGFFKTLGIKGAGFFGNDNGYTFKTNGFL